MLPPSSSGAGLPSFGGESGIRSGASCLAAVSLVVSLVVVVVVVSIVVVVVESVRGGFELPRRTRRGVKRAIRLPPG